MPSVEGADDNVPPRGFGVAGYSNTSNGVIGFSSTFYGVNGQSADGIGVRGYSLNGIGMFGDSDFGSGVHGYGNARGVNGESDSGLGVRGYSYNGLGVLGDSINSHGVYGNSDFGYGVYGRSYENYGVYAYSHTTYGLYASSDTGLAALLEGRVDMTSDVNMSGPVNMTGPVSITGSLTKPGGQFQIDHPLDPANKYLSHSFVESPDMKNIYDGIVVLDEMGEAVIELPDWFGALNKDFRYQLTAIGVPGPNLHIAEEISDDAATTSNYNNNKSRFKVAGGTSGMKVSWQVTGIRKDPWANAHRIKVEEDKPDKERGYYIYPELYDQPEEKGISHLLVPEIEKEPLLINK